MTFPDVVGHTELKSSFVDLVDKSELPHAILLLGPPGNGGLALARSIISYLFCSDKQNGESCNKCSSCRKNKTLTHPDVHFSFPRLGKLKKSIDFIKQWRTMNLENSYFSSEEWLAFLDDSNKQGNITVEEIQHIISKLSLKSFEGGHKVLLMWLPEYLGKEGNRLLKIIEEPPANTTFIFVAEDKDQILNTILSRCQTVLVKRYTDLELKKYLLDKGTYSDENISSLVQIAQGNINKIQSIEKIAENNLDNLFLDWVRSSYLFAPSRLANVIAKFAKLNRESQKGFFDLGLIFFKSIIRKKATGTDNLSLNDSMANAAEKMSKLLSFEQISEICNVLNDCSYYSLRNAHPKVLLMDTSVQVNKVMTRK